jgi:hypothetical protein
VYTLFDGIAAVKEHPTGVGAELRTIGETRRDCEHVLHGTADFLLEPKKIAATTLQAQLPQESRQKSWRER